MADLRWGRAISAAIFVSLAGAFDAATHREVHV